MEKPSSELENTDHNRLHIRKAFTLLKNHASAVANFTLQWQDLEDHLQSIQNSIQSTTFHLQNPNPNPNPSPIPKPPPSHINGIPIRDGEKLLLHLKDRAKDHNSLRDSVRGALGAAEDPGGLVLAAIAKFIPKESSAAADSSELTALRKSCVLLLEELANVKSDIDAGVREEAIKVAAAWKKQIGEAASPTEVQGFLMFLNGYGLVGEFDRNEIVSLFVNVAQRKQSVELFRDLGFSDKAHDLIQNLISRKKSTEALRFIYAFEFVDKFAPVPLLQEHVKEAKKVAKTTLKNPKSSLKEKDDATEKEQAALRSAIKCIEEYELESEYPSKSLKERIEFLKNQKKERKKANAILAKQSNSRPRQLGGNKRPFPDSAPQGRNVHHRAGPTIVMPIPMANLYARAPPGGAHHLPPRHHPAEGERMEYLIPSSMMAIPSAADSPNVSSRSAAAAVGTHHRAINHHRPMAILDGEARHYVYPAEASRYQPSAGGSFQSPRSQYSPRYHSSIFDRPAAHDPGPSLPHGSVGSPGPRTSAGLAREAYNVTGYIPQAQRAGTAHYGLPGSDAEHIDMLVERYQIRERTGQFGSAQAQASDIRSNKSPHGSLAYYPEGPLRTASHDERPVSSSGNYDLLSNSSYGYHM